MSTDTGVGVDLRATLARGSRAAHARLTSGCELLEVAADWAAGRPGDGLCPQHTRLEMAGERAMIIAGDGTPPVAEAASAELGLEIGMNPWQAARLISDALDLQFRLPRTWRLVQEHRVEYERARRLAFRTRMLTPAQAGEVDAEIAVSIMVVARSRLDKKIDAALLAADPEGTRERQEAAARWRGARLGRDTEDGLIELLFRMNADDGVGLYATCDHLADLLIKHRDHLPEGVSDRGAQSKDEWRAVAAGVLKNPFLGARVLIEFDEPDLFDAVVDTFDSFATSAHSNTTNHRSAPAADDAGDDGADSRSDEACAGVGDARDGAHFGELDLLSSASDAFSSPQPAETASCQPAAGDGTKRRGDDVGPLDGDLEALADDHVGPVQEAAGSRADRAATDGPVAEEVIDTTTTAGAARRTDAGAVTDDRTAPERRAAAQDAALRALIRALDPQRLMPRVRLNIHLSDAALRGDHPVARVEELGPQLVTTVREWLQSGLRIDLRPIIDPAGIAPVDSYETPHRMRLALFSRSPASIFPFSGSLHGAMEIDHTMPYRPPPAGPPGQTGLHGLGPMPTREHRAKTFGRMAVRQPEPGSFIWRTQTGRVIITNPAGTLDLGTDHFARTLWQAGNHSRAEQTVRDLVLAQPIAPSGDR